MDDVRVTLLPIGEHLDRIDLAGRLHKLNDLDAMIQAMAADLHIDDKTASGIIIDGDIQFEGMLDDVISALFLTSNRPLFLVIRTLGGACWVAAKIATYINLRTTANPVITVAFDNCISAGFYLFVHGHYRYIAPCTDVMHHKPQLWGLAGNLDNVTVTKTLMDSFYEQELKRALSLCPIEPAIRDQLSVILAKDLHLFTSDELEIFNFGTLLNPAL